MAVKKGGLGIGLEALFDDNSTDIQVKRTLRISEIEPNREQPRKSFDEDSIISLAESIKEYGIIQPLIVRSLDNGLYQLVAGERRWRASRMADLQEVPVIIKELSDEQSMQIALIENLQRENLNPIEEALSFKELIEKYNMKQEYLSKIVGKSRSSISNAIRLLNLPEEIKLMLEKNYISVGHAKVLMSIEDKGLMIEIAEKIIKEELTVRNLESILEKIKSECENSEKKVEKQIDSYFKEMEISLKEILGRKVSVKHSKNKGALVLEFYDKEDLKELANKLTK